MDFGSLLDTAVQVAIAIGGFAGIVIVLGPSRGYEWKTSTRLLLSSLFLMSIATVTFGFLPQILLAAGLSEMALWRISSSLHSVYVAAVTVQRIYVRARLSKKDGSTETIPINVPLRILIYIIFTLQVVNAIWLQQAWPCLTAIVLMVIGSFMVFLALLGEVWNALQ